MFKILINSVFSCSFFLICCYFVVALQSVCLANGVVEDHTLASSLAKEPNANFPCYTIPCSRDFLDSSAFQICKAPHPTGDDDTRLKGYFWTLLVGICLPFLFYFVFQCWPLPVTPRSQR